MIDAGPSVDVLTVKLREELFWTPDDVRRAAARFSVPSAEEIRRAAVNAIRKMSVGRGGLPDYAVAKMYEDYQGGLSLAQVGAIYGRTRQSIFDIFSNRDLALRQRELHPKLMHRGVAYTPGKGGYYRSTLHRKKVRLLHRVIWEEKHGPIPPGHQVTFKNADKTDFRIENLLCAPIRDVTLFHQRRHATMKHPPRVNQFA